MSLGRPMGEEDIARHCGQEELGDDPACARGQQCLRALERESGDQNNQKKIQEIIAADLADWHENKIRLIHG